MRRASGSSCLSRCLQRRHRLQQLRSLAFLTRLACEGAVERVGLPAQLLCYNFKSPCCFHQARLQRLALLAQRRLLPAITCADARSSFRCCCCFLLRSPQLLHARTSGG